MARHAVARVAAEVGAPRTPGAVERGPIGAVLLAAGASRRWGAENKLLADVDGTPMIARAAGAITKAGLPLLVVLGHEAERVQAALAASDARFVIAPEHARGMGHSLAAGIAAALPSWAGALVCLADMPWVRPETLAALAAALDGPDAVAVPVHDGARGNPVAWGRGWFARLAALDGDAGARALLAAATPTEVGADWGVLHDADTSAALAHFRRSRMAAISRTHPIAEARS